MKILILLLYHVLTHDILQFITENSKKVAVEIRDFEMALSGDEPNS